MMTPILVLIFIFMVTSGIVYGPDVRDNRRARRALKAAKKQQAIESKAEAERIANMFVLYPENTFTNDKSFELYTRLQRIWNNSPDDTSVRDAAKLIAEKHLFPAVRLATKSARDIDLHLSLIEPNIASLENGLSMKLDAQLQIMTNHLTTVADGVRALPSSLDLSRLAIESAPTPEKEAKTSSYLRFIKS